MIYLEVDPLRVLIFTICVKPDLRGDRKLSSNQKKRLKKREEKKTVVLKKKEKRQAKEVAKKVRN